MPEPTFYFDLKKYRAKLAELVVEAGMPHSFPAQIEALTTGVTRKPSTSCCALMVGKPGIS